MKPTESKQHLYTIISTMVLFKRGTNPSYVHVVLSLCLLDGEAQCRLSQDSVQKKRRRKQIHAKKSEMKGI